MFAIYIRNIFKEHRQENKVSRIASNTVTRLNESCELMLQELGRECERIVANDKKVLIGPETVRAAANIVVPADIVKRVIAVADEMMASPDDIIVPVARCRTGAKFSGTVKIRAPAKTMLAAVVSAYISVVLEIAIESIPTHIHATLASTTLPIE